MAGAWHSGGVVNPNEHPENDPRAVSLQPPVIGPSLGGGRAAAKPRDPELNPGEMRNLITGVSLLAFALIVFWMGRHLADHVAALTVIASFGTFGLLWVLYRFRVMRQPHGVLLAISSVALFAASIPFVDRVLRKLDSAARAHLSDDADAAPEKRAAAEPAPVPPQQLAKTEMPASAPPPAPPADDVVRELMVPSPDPSAGKLIRLKQDAQVEIGGRKFLIHGGDQFAFKQFADGKVTFLAGDQEVSVDAGLVTFTGQSQETPQQIMKLAEQELKKRYPAVYEKGSPENEVFVGRTNELKVELPDFFKNPRWPLDLGEQLAAQEGWIRADQPQPQLPPEKELALPKETPPGPPGPPQESPK